MTLQKIEELQEKSLLRQTLMEFPQSQTMRNLVIPTAQEEHQALAIGKSAKGYMGRLETVEDCIELYNNAPTIALMAMKTIQDGLQGKALLDAKRLICGDEWNAVSLTNENSSKWKEFLKYLDLIQPSGKPKVNVSYLLDFAGYKEIEENFTDVTPIANAGQFREVKKLSETNDPREIAKLNTEIVEAIEGAGEKVTASSIKEFALVNVEEQFKKEFNLEKPVVTNFFENMTDLTNMINEIDFTHYKTVYKELSKIYHPDKNNGSDHEVMAFMNSLNELFKFVTKRRKSVVMKEEYMKQYEEWKEKKGYESDYIKV